MTNHRYVDASFTWSGSVSCRWRRLILACSAIGGRVSTAFLVPVALWAGSGVTPAHAAALGAPAAPVAATQERNAVEDALAWLNTQRQAAGAAPVVLDAGLSNAATKHARYLVLNKDHPAVAGLRSHDEELSLPGASDEGRNAAKNSNISRGHLTVLEAVQGLTYVPLHRAGMIDPQVVRVGIGVASYTDVGGRGLAVVVDIGSARDRAAPVPSTPVVYPVPGQHDVPLDFGGENPDPRDATPGKGSEVGFMISVEPSCGTLAAPREVSLRTAENKEVPVWTVAPGTEIGAVGGSRRVRQILFFSREPLQAGTVYTAKVSSACSGRDFTREWSFKTAGEHPMDLRVFRPTSSIAVEGTTLAWDYQRGPQFATTLRERWNELRPWEWGPPAGAVAVEEQEWVLRFSKGIELRWKSGATAATVTSAITSTRGMQRTARGELVVRVPDDLDFLTATERSATYTPTQRDQGIVLVLSRDVPLPEEAWRRLSGWNVRVEMADGGPVDVRLLRWTDGIVFQGNSLARDYESGPRFASTLRERWNELRPWQWGDPAGPVNVEGKDWILRFANGTELRWASGASSATVVSAEARAPRPDARELLTESVAPSLVDVARGGDPAGVAGAGPAAEGERTP